MSLSLKRSLRSSVKCSVFIFICGWLGTGLYGISTRALTVDLEKTPKLKKTGPDLKGPVILDVRNSFDYSMGHFEKAQPLRWQDFSQTQDPHKGALDPDASLLARRLRVLGVMPSRKVVILGNGFKSKGEEGRVAWMLDYLGIKNIEIHNSETFKGKKSFGDRPDVDAAPLWLPRVNTEIRATTSEIEKLVREKNPDVLLIDVREASEFQKLGPIPGAINIPWTEFITSSGDMAAAGKVFEILKKYQVDPNRILVFYSADGVQSGYATFASLQAHLKAKNYDGSFGEWSAQRRLPVEPTTETQAN